MKNFVPFCGAILILCCMELFAFGEDTVYARPNMNSHFMYYIGKHFFSFNAQLQLLEKDSLVVPKELDSIVYKEYTEHGEGLIYSNRKFFNAGHINYQNIEHFCLYPKKKHTHYSYVTSTDAEHISVDNSILIKWNNKKNIFDTTFKNNGQLNYTDSVCSFGRINKFYQEYSLGYGYKKINKRVNIGHDGKVISSIYKGYSSSSKPFFSSTKIEIIFKPVYDNKIIKEINFNYVEKSRKTSYKPTLSRYKMVNKFDSNDRIISNNYFFISEDGKLEEIMRNTYTYENNNTFTIKREVLNDSSKVFKTDLIIEYKNDEWMQEYKEIRYSNDSAITWITRTTEYDYTKNVINTEINTLGQGNGLTMIVCYFNELSNSIFSKVLSNNISGAVLVCYNNGLLNVDFANSLDSYTINLKLYNTRGQKIFSSKKIIKNNMKNTFRTQFLKSGIYLYSLEYNGQNSKGTIQIIK